jgi:hypothetical protein
MEHGMNLVVDPIAQVPEAHLDVDAHHDETGRQVNARRECLREANISALKAADALIEVLLRAFEFAGGRAASAVRSIHRQRGG